MIFSTTSNSSAVLTERMRIDNVGYVGIATTTPNTSLDVNGAYSARLTVATASAANVIPNNVSLYRLTAVAGVQANALSVAGPQNGQFLTIINEDGDVATFAGFTIPAASGVSGIGSFVYSSTAAAWSAISLYPPTVGGTAWSITGNSGTVDGTNFIGTTDNIPFSIKVNNQKAGRIDHLLANAFFGYQTGNANSTGFFNAAYGNQTLLNNTTGSYNTALGVNALYFSTSATNNTATGYQAMYANTTGSNNTALGFQSLYNSTGNTNTAVGYLSLNTNTTGSDNTALGSAADVSASGLTNATAIGANATVGSSNALVLGNSASVLIGRSTNVNNAKLSIKDGHIQVSQTTAPTIAVSANAGVAATATLAAGSNDIIGKITFTTGTSGMAFGAQYTITFNRPYATPPIVNFSPADQLGASAIFNRQPYFTSTTTTCTMIFSSAAGASTTYNWNYIIIEP